MTLDFAFLNGSWGFRFSGFLTLWTSEVVAGAKIL